MSGAAPPGRKPRAPELLARPTIPRAVVSTVVNPGDVRFRHSRQFRHVCGMSGYLLIATVSGRAGISVSVPPDADIPNR